MGLPVLIYGKSGSGKSRSMKFFEEDEIVLFNTEKKELPFRKRFKKTGCSDDIGRIIATINQNPEKVFVIDDAGYIMTHLFMGQHRNKKGNASFEMYAERPVFEHGGYHERSHPDNRTTTTSQKPAPGHKR